METEYETITGTLETKTSQEPESVTRVETGFNKYNII